MPSFIIDCNLKRLNLIFLWDEIYANTWSTSNCVLNQRAYYFFPQKWNQGIWHKVYFKWKSELLLDVLVLQEIQFFSVTVDDCLYWSWLRWRNYVFKMFLWHHFPSKHLTDSSSETQVTSFLRPPFVLLSPPPGSFFFFLHMTHHAHVHTWCA